MNVLLKKMKNKLINRKIILIKIFQPIQTHGGILIYTQKKIFQKDKKKEHSKRKKPHKVKIILIIFFFDFKNACIYII